MKENIYLKIVQDYEDVIKKRTKILPPFCKKIVFLYKYMFGKITIKKTEKFNIYILPVKPHQLNKRIEKLINKLCRINLESHKIVLSIDLMQKKVYNLLDKYDIGYYKAIDIKKYLVFNILEYINLLQRKQLHQREITILVNDNSEINKYIIDKLAKEVKYLKIVSKNIYKFKKIEDELYNKFGIAVQFSNSYRKSLLKSELIINIDFYENEINEYKINHKAIIINLFKDLRIYTKLFNGIVINSINIKLKKETKQKFVNSQLFNSFSCLILYESLLNNMSIKEIENKIHDDKVNIVNLVGNNGIINKKEIKQLLAKNLI